MRRRRARLRSPGSERGYSCFSIRLQVGTGHHDVAARDRRRGRALEVEARSSGRARDVARIERRHAAAHLLGAVDVDTAPPQHAHRRTPRLRRVVLDRRRVRRARPSRCARRRPAASGAEPAAEATLVARQPATSIDADPALQRAARKRRFRFAQLATRRHARAEPAQQLGVPEQPLTQRDAFRRGTRHARRGASAAESRPPSDAAACRDSAGSRADTRSRGRRRVGPLRA